MASLGHPERFQSEGALNLVHNLPGWSAPVFAGRIHAGATPLGDLAAGEFVLFVSYLSCKLALSISPFLLLLLEELEVLVKGITGESFVPESLVLPQSIPALCDNLGLRTTILAMLPTLDESGVAVRQTDGRNPHRGIRISDAPTGGP
jgi:hypothetical protein